FLFVVSTFLTVVPPSATVAQGASADARALQTEAQMTDDERFGMIYSILGAVTVIGVKPDPRIPEGVPMSAGYAQGVPRLGVPAQFQTDASMGITNPGYRPDDPGATAFPSSILVGS